MGGKTSEFQGFEPVASLIFAVKEVLWQPLLMGKISHKSVGGDVSRTVKEKKKFFLKSRMLM